VSAAIVSFPDQPIRPNIAAASKVLDSVGDDPAGLFSVALVALKVVEAAQGSDFSQRNQRRVSNALTLAFLALGSALGVPRDVAAAMLSDD
jgi:hypothetical protein